MTAEYTMAERIQIIKDACGLKYPVLTDYYINANEMENDTCIAVVCEGNEVPQVVPDILDYVAATFNDAEFTRSFKRVLRFACLDIVDDYTAVVFFPEIRTNGTEA